ncbi:hypothetical protein G9A89_017006 [Geosiphon pyriformis]|nr:hypothetical protein G9A89_017006 [Geosiphon pyriformis]
MENERKTSLNLTNLEAVQDPYKPWSEPLGKLLANSEKCSETECVLFLQDTKNLEILLNYFPSMDESPQIQFLERLYYLAEYTDLNKWTLFKANATNRLLKTLRGTTGQRPLVVESILKLVELVCAFSVKVSDVKLILNLICHKNEDSRKLEESTYYHGPLVKLLNSIAQKENTLDFFYFYGTNSGIILPRIDKFPTNGYSFFTWFKMDSTKLHFIHDPSSCKDSEPRLFSLFNEFASVEAYFSKNELHIECHKGKEVSKASMTNFKFTQNRWYFITVVHQPPKRGWKSTPSEIRVLVDGGIKWKTKLEYPVDTPNEDFVHCAIGASMAHSRQKNDNQTDSNDLKRTNDNPIHLKNSFCGQMTAIYLIAEILTQEQIDAIYSLGRNHSTPTSALHLFDGSRILLNFHVKASEKEKCFNLAPRSIQQAHGASLAALVAVHKCSTLSLQNAIRSLGDIEVLFPMILRFDYLDSVSHQAPFQSQEDFFASESPCRSFFALITGFLQNNQRSQAQIIKSRGIKVISLLIQQIGPRYLTITAFQSIVALANTLSRNEELSREIHTHLIFEFRLWMYSSLDVQKYCIEFLKNFCDSRKQMSRENFGVQYFLDVLQTIYWYEQTERSVPHRHSGVGVTRPKTPQIKELRSMVLNIIRGYIKTDITKDETVCILRNLAVSQDDVHLCEILQLLLDLLLQQLSSKPNKDIVENIASYGGYEVLCETMKRRRDENVRIYCLKIITYLITCPITPARFIKKLRFLETNPINLTKLLDSVPLTQRIYEALLDWAMERFTISGLTGCDQERQILSEENEHQNTLKNFRVVFAILSLLDCEGTKSSLQCKILEDFAVLFRQNVEYCVELNQMWCWQRLLVRLASVHSVTDSISPKRNGHNQKDITEWVIEFLTLVIWNLFPVDKSAFRAVEETVFIIWTSDNANRIEIIRSFISLLLSCIANDIREVDLETYRLVKLENIIRLISFTEEVIFSHRDISQVVEQEMNGCDPNTPLSTSYSSSFRSIYESGFPTINALGINDMPSASNPWEENRTLAETYLEIVNALDLKAGWRLETIPPNRIDLRPGDTCRMVLRILIAGITTPNQELREKALENLMCFVERHVRTPDAPLSPDRKQLEEFFCTDSDIFRQHINMLLGEIHEAFIASQSTNGSYEHKTVFAYYFAMHKCQTYISPLAENKYFSDTLEAIWTSSKFNEQVFVQFVTSRDWMTIHDRLIVPAMKAAHEDDFVVVKRIKAGFAKKLGKFFYRSKKEDQNAAKLESTFDIELNSIVQSYKEEEISRITDLEIDKKSDNTRTTRRWLSKFHELTQERGAWSNGRQTDIHWKLDRSENYCRMRRKLTINYEHDSHSEASAKRDKTPIKQNRVRSKSSNIQRIKRNSVLGRCASPSLNMIDPWTDLWTSSQPKNEEPESSEEIEDEEWNVVAGDVVVGTVNVSIDKPIFTAECELIVLLSAIKGRLELTTTTLTFLVDPQSILQEFDNIEHGSLIVDTEMLRDKKWLLSEIREIPLRNYLLRRSALEIFFTDQTNYFFNFPDASKRKRLRSKILSLKPSSMVNQDNRSPAEILARSGLTQRWQRHEISNFEYLTHLNSIAGRSFNDLSQYPVFPWILADYESEILDLTDPKVFRDLSKPVGALNQERLAQVLERYEGFEDPSGRIPKFHYGTHYSSAATVAGFLIRLEPFTSVHISLQGGKFDHADRLFHSIQSTWHACLHASGDVRELIPEFYYLPEFLTNHNHFDLGVRQDGTHLDDVVLPRWAHSPEEFIRKQREALESDYVSANIHNWIDLIFGYKQTGEEAIRAHNVFYYLTYENGINMDTIEDELEQKSIEQQIYHFGQTPLQLLKKPHPQRLPRRDFLKKDILNCQENHKQYLVQLISRRLLYIAVSNVDTEFFSTAPVQQIVTIDEDGIIGSHRISPNPVTSEIPFSVEVDPMLEYKSRLSSPFCHDAVISPRCFTCSKDGKVLISCGHWDNTIKVTLTETGKTIDSIPGHDDVVTTVGISENGRTLITGSRSSCVLSWNVNLSSDNEFLNISHTPLHAFYGHDDEITCVAVNAEHDMLVSGSKDGTCIVHSFRNAQYVRTLRPLEDLDATVENVCISQEGNIVAYAERNDEYFLYTYTINGKLLGTVEIVERLNDMITSSIKNFVLISNARGIALFDCLNLQLHYQFDTPFIARSIALSQDASRIYFCGGGDDGKILIIAHQSHVESDLHRDL